MRVDDSTYPNPEQRKTLSMSWSKLAMPPLYLTRSSSGCSCTHKKASHMEQVFSWIFPSRPSMGSLFLVQGSRPFLTWARYLLHSSCQMKMGLRTRSLHAVPLASPCTPFENLQKKHHRFTDKLISDMNFSPYPVHRIK